MGKNKRQRSASSSSSSSSNSEDSIRLGRQFKKFLKYHKRRKRSSGRKENDHHKSGRQESRKSRSLSIEGSAEFAESQTEFMEINDDNSKPLIILSYKRVFCMKLSEFDNFIITMDTARLDGRPLIVNVTCFIIQKSFCMRLSEFDN